MYNQTARTVGTLINLPDGTAGVRETLKRMRAIVRASLRNPGMVVRNRALSIVQGLPSKDFNAELFTIWRWVDTEIRFVRDIRGIETLQTPERTLELGAGDCDDHAILVSALAENLGFPTRFHAVGFAPEAYQHVFTEANLHGKWIPLETTVQGSYIGWYPPGIQASMFQPI